MTQPKKKVLYLITKSNWGGAQRYVYDLATEAPTIWEPVVACGGTGTAGSAVGTLAEKLSHAAIRTIHLPSLSRDVGLADFQAFREILRLLKTERPDVLHLNSSKAAGLGALAGRIARVPRIVYTAHGWPFWEDRSLVNRALRFFFSWLTVLLSHVTICVSDFDRMQLRYVPFMRSRLTTIRNGVPAFEFLDRSVARAALFDSAVSAAHARDVWVATYAELHPNKNLARAVDAVKHYNATHDRKIFYVICGTGEQHDLLQKKADSSILLKGFIPESAYYLKAFDVFLLPSLKEGVPYAILEAGLAELPVVASSVGGIPEAVAGATNTYLVDPKNVADIAEKLEVAIHDLAAAAPLATLREVVKDRFSLAAMRARTFDLYQCR